MTRSTNMKNAEVLERLRERCAALDAAIASLSAPQPEGAEAVDFWVCPDCSHHYMADGIVCDCHGRSSQKRMRHVRMAPVTAPQPPAEAQADEVVCLECGQPTMHMGQVCYACSHPAAKPAEAQAVLERIASKLRDAGARLPAPQVTGTVDGAVITGLSIALALVEAESTNPPPSAPVGVVDVDALAQEIRRVDGEHSLGASALAEALVPYLARTTLAQQPAAVDGGWRKKAADWLEAAAAQQEANNQRWPDHAAAYETWRNRPSEFRELARRILAAQQGGRSDD